MFSSDYQATILQSIIYIIGMEGDGEVQTLNLHPETRNSILFKTLERLWESHKLAYIACSFLLILLLITAIIFVLTTVVVPSERYHFLEQKEAEELRAYLGLRRFGDNLLPMSFI